MVSISRCLDKNGTAWLECWVQSRKPYKFVTNGRKLYHGQTAHDKAKELKRCNVVEYDKCSIEDIIKELTKYHPDTPELKLLKSIELGWMFVGIYEPYVRQSIRHFFVKDISYVIYGSGATHLDDEYVLFTTIHLGRNWEPTYESITENTTEMQNFLRRAMDRVY